MINPRRYGMVFKHATIQSIHLKLLVHIDYDMLYSNIKEDSEYMSLLDNYLDHSEIYSLCFSDTKSFISSKKKFDERHAQIGTLKNQIYQRIQEDIINNNNHGMRYHVIAIKMDIDYLWISRHLTLFTMYIIVNHFRNKYIRIDFLQFKPSERMNNDENTYIETISTSNYTTSNIFHCNDSNSPLENLNNIMNDERSAQQIPHFLPIFLMKIKKVQTHFVHNNTIYQRHTDEDELSDPSQLV